MGQNFLTQLDPTHQIPNPTQPDPPIPVKILTRPDPNLAPSSVCNLQYTIETIIGIAAISCCLTNWSMIDTGQESGFVGAGSFNNNTLYGWQCMSIVYCNITTWSLVYYCNYCPFGSNNIADKQLSLAHFRRTKLSTNLQWNIATLCTVSQQLSSA